MSDKFEEWWKKFDDVGHKGPPAVIAGIKAAARAGWDARGDMENTKEKRFGCRFGNGDIRPKPREYCILEMFDDTECDFARNSNLDIEDKTDCPYWRPIND